MRPEGSPEELEHRRQLAIRRYIEGYSADEIAEFLGVSTRAVWRWFASFRGQGLQGFGVGFHPHSLSRWLRGHGLTPQKPERVPRERDPAAIAEWLKSQWPRIKKRRGDRVPTSP